MALDTTVGALNQIAAKAVEEAKQGQLTGFLAEPRKAVRDKTVDATAKATVAVGLTGICVAINFVLSNAAFINGLVTAFPGSFDYVQRGLRHLKQPD